MNFKKLCSHLNMEKETLISYVNFNAICITQKIIYKLRAFALSLYTYFFRIYI